MPQPPGNERCYGLCGCFSGPPASVREYCNRQLSEIPVNATARVVLRVPPGQETFQLRSRDEMLVKPPVADLLRQGIIRLGQSALAGIMLSSTLTNPAM